MNIPKQLDYFGTLWYSLDGDFMEVFMKQNFNVERIIMSHFFVSQGKAPSCKKRKHHALLYIMNAKRCYSFNCGKEIYVKGNEVLFIPKDLEYTVSGTEIREGYTISFDINADLPLSPFVFKPKNLAGFLESFKAAATAWSNKGLGFEMRCKSALYDIICNMQSEYEMSYISKSTLNRLKPAIDYMHKEYTNENISIPVLAELCGMSEVLFRRHFKNSMGVSPLRYINNLKIIRAKELLSDGICSVSEAAFLSGFHDECYFSREFKRATGVTPSTYKKSG